LREGLTLAEDGSVNIGQPREAVPLLEEAFRALEPYAQNDNDLEARSVMATAGHYLGDVLRHFDARRAMEVYDHSLKRIREVPEDVNARRLEAVLLAGSSYAARWLGREEDARRRIDTAFRLLRDTQDYPAEIVRPASEVATALRAQSDHYTETGKPREAIDVYRELLRKMMASNPDPGNDLINATRLSDAQASLVTLLRGTDQNSEAAALQKQRLELWQSWDRKLPNSPFVLRKMTAASSR
jgi:tetratricopeptide (TPR) repeat protein